MSDYLCRNEVADLHALHRRWQERFPFLLESRLHSAITGRYSLLLGDVSQTLTCHKPHQVNGFLEEIARSARHRTAAKEAAPPFVGGWFAYLAYEAAAGLLPHVEAQESTVGAIARASYCRSAVIVDHINQCSWYVGDARDLQECSIARLADAANPQKPFQALAEFCPEDGEHFCSQVERVIDYIHSGDIYQANLSRRWQGPKLDRRAALDCYSTLRERNKACFSASVWWSDFAILSASPERLFRLDQNGTIETRPIAGTRPTATDPIEDAVLKEELRQHPKEQAEHIMLVDLERNDLGQISQKGSVRVDELLALESYASVHHLVSNISGTLRPNTTLADIFGAVFPGGTITGCPKIRCMQIISELEARPRGAYTGSLGYISDCGSMDFNILIRSLVWQDGRLHLDAGAGIVADSDPSAEMAETQAKANGVLQALASGSACV